MNKTIDEGPKITKKFQSSTGLRHWLDSPMTAKLYNVLFVDWTTNIVKVEGRRL